MANEIEICNLALSRMGAGRIASFSDGSPESIACSVHYALARDSVFRDFEWSFASKPLTLALLDETHPEWTYVYAYPADCIKARRIANPYSREQRDKIPFEVGLSATGNFQTVLSNYPQAILIYTSKVENSAVYDTYFCDALAWRLASELTQPLRAEAALAASLANRYQQVVSTAEAKSANEQFRKADEGSSYTDCR